MTRIHFEEEKQRLNEGLVRMGLKVEEDLRKAIQALRNQDADLARLVRDDDVAVNALQHAIEDACGVLIATQQPVAQDMRELLAMVKIANDLERIGDHAVHLAKLVIKMKDEPYLKSIARVRKMAEIGCEMIMGAMQAFAERSADKARSIAAGDDRIDKLNKSVVKNLLELMREKPKLIKPATRIIAVSGHMERLGDYVTNICESVVYCVEGTRVDLG
jgi:phosphate transport system protein